MPCTNALLNSTLGANQTYMSMKISSSSRRIQRWWRSSRGAPQGSGIAPRIFKREVGTVITKWDDMENSDPNKRPRHKSKRQYQAEHRPKPSAEQGGLDWKARFDDVIVPIDKTFYVDDGSKF